MTLDRGVGDLACNGRLGGGVGPLVLARSRLRVFHPSVSRVP